MDVEITGYEDAIKQTEKIMKDISQLVPDLGNEFVALGEKLLKRAKEICNDPECRLFKRKRIEFVDATFLMEIEYQDNKARNCMIQAIKETLPFMAAHQQQVFEAHITELEKANTK